MKIENGVERIAWRFTKGELKSLLTLLGRTELPGTAIRAGMPDTETLEALTEAGIVLYCGERVLVDRARRASLTRAAASARFLRLEAEGGVALLYRGETLCVAFPGSWRRHGAAGTVQRRGLRRAAAYVDRGSAGEGIALHPLPAWAGGKWRRRRGADNIAACAPEGTVRWNNAIYHRGGLCAGDVGQL